MFVDHVHFDGDGVNALDPECSDFHELSDIDKEHTRFFYINSLTRSSSMKEIYQKRSKPAQCMCKFMGTNGKTEAPCICS